MDIFFLRYKHSIQTVQFQIKLTFIASSLLPMWTLPLPSHQEKYYRAQIRGMCTPWANRTGTDVMQYLSGTSPKSGQNEPLERAGTVIKFDLPQLDSPQPRGLENTGCACNISRQLPFRVNIPDKHGFSSILIVQYQHQWAAGRIGDGPSEPKHLDKQVTNSWLLKVN